MRAGINDWKRRSASVGYILANSQNLTTANVPYVNQGNTRKQVTIGSNSDVGVLVNGYTPIIADASATYKLDSFPLYPGAFPIKVAGEYINNLDTISGNGNNQGFWAGVTFGKSGKQHTWDIPIATNIWKPTRRMIS